MKDGLINILYLEPSSGFGGSAGALVNLINHLDRKKFKPILAIKNYGQQFEKITNVEIIKLPSYNEPQELSNLKFLIFFLKNVIPEAIRIYFAINKRRVSLVHTNTSIRDAIPAIIAAKLSGKPCICHFRGTRKLLKREVFFSRWIDKLIVLNKKVYAQFSQVMDKNKIVIIYDGIDFSEYDNVRSGLLRKEFNFDSAQLVGLIGRIIKGKGQKEFILAAKEVLKKKLNAMFLLVGDAKGGESNYYQEIKELVNREGLEESIIFTGWRSDVKNIISDLDILVFSTTTFPEGLPNILLEAMALKKAVVATDIPGSSDIVVDSKTGFLVSPADIDLMAERIIYLLENPEVSEIMGINGRERVREIFNIDNTVSKIEDLYGKTH